MMINTVLGLRLDPADADRPGAREIFDQTGPAVRFPADSGRED